MQLTEYDAAGRAYRTIDNLGRINETQYDDAGRTVRTIQNYDNGDVDETDTDQDVTVEYQYDSGGRLVTMTAYNAKGSGNGVQEQATKYLYTSADQRLLADGRGLSRQRRRALAELDHQGLDDHRPTTATTFRPSYDRLGRTTSTTDQRGVVHEYTFDSAGRLSADTVTSLGASGIVDDAVCRIGTTYDDIGRAADVTSYSDTSGTTAVNQVKYAYNGWGNVVREYQEHDGAVDGNTLFVQYNYDDGASGGVAKYVRLDDVVYPDGNRDSRLRLRDAGAIDDIMSRLATIGDGTDTYAAYKYLGAGRIVDRGLRGHRREARLRGRQLRRPGPLRPRGGSGLDRLRRQSRRGARRVHLHLRPRGQPHRPDQRVAPRLRRELHLRRPRPA